MGDCNRILVDEVFPTAKYGAYRRALCLLDPYGLDLDWGVVETAGRMETVELFLNFPVMDMNRNVLWRDPQGVDERDKLRMTRFWGDDSWHDAAYSERLTLFGPEDEKRTNQEVVQAYCARLKEVAGFAYVPEPIPMRNDQNAVVYYLIFASQNATGGKIADYLLRKYATT